MARGRPTVLGRRRRVEVKDPLRADAHEHVAADVAQPVTEGDAVVASVEHEEWHVAIVGNPVTRRVTWSMVRADSSSCTTSRATSSGWVQLSMAQSSWRDPLVAPPGDDALAVGLLGRRVVEPSLGAGRRVAAVERGRVDREDERPRTGTVLEHERAQRVVVDPTEGQRLVEAAVRAAEDRLHRQGRNRADGPGRTAHGVAQLEERVTPR